MGKSLFLTGGTGYIGSALVARALASGYTVTALSRSSTSDSRLLSLGATPIRGDLTTLPVLTAAARAADVVVSIADAIAGDFSISTAERFRINDAANDALALGMEGSGKPLVLTGGSLYAAAREDGGETDEASPGWPAGHWAGFELGRLKREYLEMGVRAVQVRLAPWVYGRGGSGVRLFMGMWMEKGNGMVVDGGEKCTTGVHVDDVVELYLRVAERGRAGRAYNATAQNDITHAQLAGAICRAIDVPCAFLTYEEAAEEVGGFLAGFLSTENRASSRKAREELGWEVKGRGILEEIETGSYAEVAKVLRENRSA